MSPLAWVLLIQACTPAADMITILAHDGSTSAAIGIHGATAAVVLATGCLVLRETSKQIRSADADVIGQVPPSREEGRLTP
ncbi:DUF4267 domain-containing protein [Nonomuraea sp. NPDC059194]|uniref:DUF4267 domain-containing protein n=1 Tax=Nonomuraea sp. NPDC059194 TaxID=3346764 RepID=UPI00369FC89A